MKMLEDTLEVVIETWDDPGDYPSGAGSGPLPSYDYVAEVVGTVVVELTNEEFADEGFSGVEYDLTGVTVSKWKILKDEFNAELLTHTFTLEVEAFDASGYDSNDYDYEPEEYE